MTSRWPNVLLDAVRPSGRARPPVQLLGRRAVRRAAARLRSGPVEDGVEGVGVEAEGLGPVPPRRHQPARGRRRRPWGGGWRRWRAGRPWPSLAVLLEVGLDLLAAGRELPQHRPGDAGDVGDAVADRAPLDAEPAGELPAEVRLVEVPDRGQPRVQRPAIQRRPLARRRGSGRCWRSRRGCAGAGHRPGRCGAGTRRRRTRRRRAPCGRPCPAGPGTPPLRAPAATAPIAASAALRTSFDTSGSPRANSSDTDFGAQNVDVERRRRSAPSAPPVSRYVPVGSTWASRCASASASTSPSRPRRCEAAPIHWPGASLRAGVVLLGAPGDGVDVVRLLAMGQLPQAQHGPTAQRTADRTIRHSTAGASASLILGWVSAGWRECTVSSRREAGRGRAGAQGRVARCSRARGGFGGNGVGVADDLEDRRAHDGEPARPAVVGLAERTAGPLLELPAGHPQRAPDRDRPGGRRPRRSAGTASPPGTRQVRPMRRRSAASSTV